MRKILGIFFIFSLAFFYYTGCKTVDEYTGLNSAQIVYDEYRDSKNKSSSGDSDSGSKTSKTGSKSKSSDWGFGDDDNSDDHYIQPDDYFVAEEELGKKQHVYVYISKMVTPATKATKNEAKFMRVKDSDELWSKLYWKTRPAIKSDIKIGAVVICFDGNNEDDVNMPPKDKGQARQWNWFMTKITDTSDLHKGFVTTAGGTKVSLNALRVTIK